MKSLCQSETSIVWPRQKWKRLGLWITAWHANHTVHKIQGVVHILDAKYEKADLQSNVSKRYSPKSSWEHFDRTLGDWNTTSISFELKEGAKPYHGSPFPVPRVYKETIIKEWNRLCEMGVFKFQPASEWVSPSFTKPKKDKNICFISDFWEVNKQLVRKLFPRPKISTVCMS